MNLHYNNGLISVKRQSSGFGTTWETMASLALSGGYGKIGGLIYYASELSEDEKKEIRSHREKIRQHEEKVEKIYHKSAWRKLRKIQKNEDVLIDYLCGMMDERNRKHKLYSKKTGEENENKRK